MRIAINGFGRIGRTFLRTVMKDKKALTALEVVVINIGPASIDTAAHLFKYDTLMGTYPGDVQLKENKLIIDGYSIQLIHETDPAKLPWGTYEIEWIVDCSGKFTKRDQAQLHLNQGARAILISAPAKGEDVSIILGVNEEKFNPAKDRIVSLGSCTTNAIMPLVKVMDDAFGVVDGFMTTVHAYTNSQVLLDVEDGDVRRARAAALNIIPTTTGAMEMLEKIIPSLANRIGGVSLRIPVGKVSLIDFTFSAKDTLSVQSIHEALHYASENRMRAILKVTQEKLVSSDYSGCSYSVVVDGELTGVQGRLGKLFGWYDNEWGYSERLKDFLLYAANA